MRILFVTHHYLNGNGGGVFASRAYINAFCEICDGITLLYPAKGTEAPEGVNPKVEFIPVANNKFKVFKFVDLLAGRMHRYFGVFERYLASGDYDTVVFDTSLVTWKNIDIAHEFGAKVCTIHHNYQYEYSRDNARGLIKLVTLFWIKRYEKAAVQKSDLNLTLTKDDKALLEKHYDPMGRAKIEVLGVFEPEPRDLPLVNNEVQKGRYVITGTLSALQTYESLKSWVNEYFPVLKASIGYKSLTIAGKDPSEKLLKLCSRNGIGVVANPASMDEVLNKADVYICPVSLGGGLKLRIMDGLRYGLPVITHAVSSRGYESFIGKCLFSYEDSHTFSDSICHVQKVVMTNKEIGDLFHEEFSFMRGIQKLNYILAQYNF